TRPAAGQRRAAWPACRPPPAADEFPRASPTDGGPGSRRRRPGRPCCRERCAPSGRRDRGRRACVLPPPPTAAGRGGGGRGGIAVGQGAVEVENDCPQRTHEGPPPSRRRTCVTGAPPAGPPAPPKPPPPPTP